MSLSTADLAALIDRFCQQPGSLTVEEMAALKADLHLRRDDVPALLEVTNRYRNLGRWDGVQELLQKEVARREQIAKMRDMTPAEVAAIAFDTPTPNQQPSGSPDGRAWHELTRAELADLAFGASTPPAT